MIHETTKLRLLEMALDIVSQRVPYDDVKQIRVITTESVIEEAKKLEEFFSTLPKKPGKKAEFLTENQ